MKKDKLYENLWVAPSGLRVHTYSWQKQLADVERLIVVAPGLPNYPGKDFFKSAPESVRDCAFCVVYYYGYWLSGGGFTVANTAKSVSDCVAFLRSGQLVNAFGEEPFKPFEGSLEVVGYSFGANPVLRALHDIDPETVAKIGLAAPLATVYEEDMQADAAIKEQFFTFNETFCGFLAAGYRELIRPVDSPEWQQYFQGTNKDSRVILDPAWRTRIQLYYGENDTSVPKQLLEPILGNLPAVNIHIDPIAGHDKQLIWTFVQA